MPPAIVSRTLNVRHRTQIGFDHRFQFGRAGGGRSQTGFKGLGPQIVENDRPTFKDGSEEALLTAEMIVGKRDIDVSHSRDLSQGDTVIAMLGEQYFSRVENTPFASASFDHDSPFFKAKIGLPTKIGLQAKIGQPLMRAGSAGVKRPTLYNVNST